MELPNYSKQLLLHLHTLCKEQQFCDCTIFIGSMHFRAHKLILAAASLLFKSLLDDTDTLSIDSSVVTADEFTLLLQIVYTGKLPPGKHNLTKVISVADTLHMFDVAVSCKKLLTDLMNRSNQSQLTLDASGPENATAKMPVSQASKVRLSATDGRIPEPLTVLGPPGEVPHLPDRETSADVPEIVAVDIGSGTLAAVEALRTMSSSGTFATDLALEDTRKTSLEMERVTARSEMQHVAPEHVEKIIGLEPNKVLKGPSPSEAATILTATEVARDLVHSEISPGLLRAKDITSSTHTEAVSGLAHSESVFVSDTSKEFSSPASVEVVMSPSMSEAVAGQASPPTLAGQAPLVTVTYQALSEAVVDQAPSEAAACQVPPESVTDQAPFEMAADSADSQVVAGLPSETMTYSKPSHSLNGSALSELATSPAPLEAQTSPATSVASFTLVASDLGIGMGPSEIATRTEISSSVADIVASRSGAAPTISGSGLTIPTTTEHRLSQKSSGAVLPSSCVERSSPPFESIVALTLAELEAGGIPAETHPIKCKPASMHTADNATQSNTVAQTEVMEQKTSSDCRSTEAESNPRTLQSYGESSDDGSAYDIEEELEPPMKKGRYDKSEAMERCSDLDFLLRYENVFSEAFSDSPALLKLLSNCQELEEREKQVLVGCCQGGEGESAFKRILEKVKDGQIVPAQTVVRLLEHCKETQPKVKAVLLHREKMANEPLGQTGSSEEGKTLFGLLLEHRDDLVQSITELSPIIECLDTAEDGFLSDLEKKVILDCCTGRSHGEAMECLLKQVIEEKALSAESLVKLLHAVKEAFPDLCLLLDDLESQAKITAHLNPEEYGIELLRQYNENLAEILTDPQVLLRGLAVAINLAPREHEVIENILKKNSCASGFASLASAVLEERTLSAMACWQLVLALQEGGYPLNMLLEDIQREPDAELFFQSVVKRETVATEMLLRHSTLITEAIRESNVLESIAPGEEGFIEAVKEVLSVLSEKEDCVVSPDKQFMSSVMQKSIPALKFCQLLCSLHESCPNLQPLMQELEQMGLLIEGEGDTKDIRKWKVNNEDQIEALDKAELSPGPVEVEPFETECEKDSSASVKKEGKRVATTSKNSYVCKYCKKIFLFRCRLVVHVKRCRMALEKAVPCPECKEMKASKKELERHMQEAHSSSSTDRAAKVRKKRMIVTCDICGKEFAHPSGMQYHKRAEHFDEKPFSCIDCGAKFAANSTLKNHLRLHTGERPYMCKHCQMTFTQAAALAYHTKKKHSEGKMYACQYCDALFAQSIELTRHVRTHTGDKPYVCRECGKGFSQANGLAIHLRTFHNIDDPYDCQKCRMSFTSLDEHRKHIQEIHFRDYHPCPTCSKIFSAPSLLERHMVIHVGGKPYNCEICDKSYQQLSGLWYHNRTHHPDIFAAQNHRSAKFTSLLCIACDRGFSTALCLQKHVKEEHADMKLPECDKCQQVFPSPAALQVHMKCKHSGAQPFQCLYCKDAFRFPGALQHHVATEHFSQTENTFGCEVCGELFTSQAQLQSHYEIDHPEVVISEGHATPTQVDSSEQVIMDESQLDESQLIVAMPDSQGSQNTSEIVAVSMKDLLDGTVTLICGETK